MVCRECPDGHWECGEEWDELCQEGRLWMQSKMSPAQEAQPVSQRSMAGGQQVMPGAPGAWMPLGTFVATFNVYYRPGADGVPIVKIVPVTQYRQPVNLQQEPALQQQAVPQQQQQQQYARRGNEHHSGFRNDRVGE